MSKDIEPVTVEQFEAARSACIAAWDRYQDSRDRQDAYARVVNLACRLPIPVPHPFQYDFDDSRRSAPDFNPDGEDDGECTLPPQHVGAHASRWDLSPGAPYAEELTEYFRSVDRELLLWKAQEEAFSQFQALQCVTTDANSERCLLRRGHDEPHAFSEPLSFDSGYPDFGSPVGQFDSVTLELSDFRDYGALLLALMNRETYLREQEQRDPENREMDEDGWNLTNEELLDQAARIRRLIQQINDQVKK